MTHRDAIAILLGVDQPNVGPSRGRGRPPSSTLHHARIAGRPSVECTSRRRIPCLLTMRAHATALRLRGNSGSAVRVDGPSAVEIQRAHPGVARHLGWCTPCRERLADLHSFAASLATAGAPLPKASPSCRPRLRRERWRPRPRWLDTATQVERTFRELVRRVVLQIRNGVVSTLACPVGVEPLPAGAPAGAGAGPRVSKNHPQRRASARSW